MALRKEWLKTLPAQDHVWVANGLFTESGRLKSQLQMWWHPAQLALVYSQPPAKPNVFFHHRFFLWMPYRMLAYPFVCSQPGCDRCQLSSCGLYKTVRRVYGDGIPEMREVPQEGTCVEPGNSGTAGYLQPTALSSCSVVSPGPGP